MSEDNTQMWGETFIQNYSIEVAELKRKNQELVELLNENNRRNGESPRGQQRVQLLLDEINTVQQREREREREHELELSRKESMHQESDRKKQSIIEEQRMVNEVLNQTIDGLREELKDQERVIEEYRANIATLNGEKSKWNDGMIKNGDETVVIRESLNDFQDSMQELLERDRKSEEEQKRFLQKVDETHCEILRKLNEQHSVEKASKQQVFGNYNDFIQSVLRLPWIMILFCGLLGAVVGWMSSNHVHTCELTEIQEVPQVQWVPDVHWMSHRNAVKMVGQMCFGCAVAHALRLLFSLIW